MRTRPVLISATLALALLAGCVRTVRVGPAKADPAAPKIPLSAKVEVPDGTQIEVHEVRDGGPGAWAIEVGEGILRYSKELVEPMFNGPLVDKEPLLTVTIKVEDFDVRNYEAHCDLEFTVERNDRKGDAKRVFRRTYHGAGSSQPPGESTMKTAMAKTTEEALRSAFAQFTKEAVEQHRSW